MNIITDTIGKLPEKHNVLFCATICRRMYSSYLKFYTDEKWGNPTIYANSVEDLFLYSLSEGIYKLDKSKNVETIFPDLDEFESASASYAFDACEALLESMEYADKGEIAHVLNCSLSATNTADMFIQEYLDIDPNIPGLDEIINNHPFMKLEVNSQLTVLNYLASVDVITLAVVNHVKTMSNTNIVDLSLLNI